MISGVVSPLVGRPVSSDLCRDSFARSDWKLIVAALTPSEWPFVWADQLGMPAHFALDTWKRVKDLELGAPPLWSELDPGAKSTLTALQTAGFHIGALSNARGNVEGLLTYMGLRPFFHDIVDSAIVGIEKPDPRIFLLSCERLRVGINQCAYVGDTVAEIEAARVLGAVPILFDRLHLYDEVHHFYSIRELSQLLPILSAP